MGETLYPGVGRRPEPDSTRAAAARSIFRVPAGRRNVRLFCWQWRITAPFFSFLCRQEINPLKIFKMKSLIFLSVLCGLLVLSAFGSAVSARGVRIPIGEREYATIVAEFPDTEEYMTDSGHYIDLATLHTAYTIAYVPVYVTEEPRLIGYCEAEDTCYEIDDEYLAEMLAANELDGEELNKLTFWHRYGGKLVLAAVLALVAFGYFVGRSDDEEAEPAKE